MRMSSLARWSVLTTGGFVALTLAGCTTPTMEDASSPPSAADTRSEQFPDIVDVETTQNGDSTWNFSVTVSSPYDSPARYADGWRVLGEDGEVYGEHLVTHDHADEQPFTRTQTGITIPDGVTEVTIEGRDQLSGYGGETVTVTLK